MFLLLYYVCVSLYRELCVEVVIFFHRILNISFCISECINCTIDSVMQACCCCNAMNDDDDDNGDDRNSFAGKHL